MRAAVDRPGRDLDWVLALGAALVGCVAFALVWRGSSGSTARPELPSIATLSGAGAEVRRRPSGTLVWEELATGARLWEGDALFVPPQSSATVSFDDGTRLQLDENTLVALEPRALGEAAPTVRLERGQVVGRSGEGGLAFKTAQGVALLETGSEARMEKARSGGEEVAVLQGTAKLGADVRMEAQDFAVAAAGGWTRGRHAIALEGPRPLWRSYFGDGSPDAVALSWRGKIPAGAKVEVLAGADGAEEVIFGAPAHGGTASFTPASAGRFSWRVVDGTGRPLSETRSFEVVADLPPRVVSPRAAEAVEGFRDQKIPFAWTRVPGVTTYQLEVADNRNFSRVVFRKQVEGTGLRVGWTAEEGRYHWRVRALAADRPDSPWSNPATFRYLSQPLLDAPELINPELELEP